MNGTFTVTNQPITNFAVWAATANAQPLVGDFNGDGKTDVVLTGPAGTIPVAFSLSSPVIVVNMVPASLSGETNQDSEPFLAVNPTSRNGWSAQPSPPTLVTLRSRPRLQSNHRRTQA